METADGEKEDRSALPAPFAWWGLEAPLTGGLRTYPRQTTASYENDQLPQR